MLGAFADRLVDFAADTEDEQAAQEGLSLFQEHEAILRDYFEPGLYEYNVGNALHTLAKFDRAKNPQYNLVSIERLTEAKDFYWRALQARGSHERNWPELMINIANTLDECSRTPEALYWYDEAIRADPSHPMAQGNRAQSLIWFKEFKLEHELLFLVEDGQDLGPLQRVLGFKEPLQVQISSFRNESLQLLRFTAAAIMNFALFVRQRALMLPTKDGAAFIFKDRRRSRV